MLKKYIHGVHGNPIFLLDYNSTNTASQHAPTPQGSTTQGSTASKQAELPQAQHSHQHSTATSTEQPHSTGVEVQQVQHVQHSHSQL